MKITIPIILILLASLVSASYNPAVEYLSLNGTDTIFESGNVGIGTASPAAKLAVVDFENNNNLYGTLFRKNDTSNNAAVYGNLFQGYSNRTSGNFYGLYSQAVSTAPAVGGTYTAIIGNALVHQSQNGSAAKLYGVKGVSVNQNNQTVTDAYGVYGNVYSYINDGTITNAYSVYAAGPSILTGSGTITNAYALYVTSPTQATTDNFAVYQLGTADNYFQGNVGLGHTNPSYKLDINDDGANGYGLRVTGGGTGGPIAHFERDVGGTGAVKIDSADNNPQIEFASGTNTFSIGTSGTDFKISDHTALDTNDRLTIDSTGNVGIGTSAPGSYDGVATKLEVKGTGTMGIAINTDLNSSGSFVLAENDVVKWHMLNRGNAGDRFEIFAGGNDAKFVITQDGNVGIGTTSPAGKLEVNGNVTATAYYYSSDENLKENINQITNAIEKIQQLDGVEFTWKETGQESIGVIAQNIEETFPELVATKPDGIKTVQYGNLVAPLIEAVKEQHLIIESQQEEIETLKTVICNQFPEEAICK